MACVIYVIPTATISDIPSLSVRSQQLYTPSIDWHKRFEFGRSCVHIWCWRTVIQNFIQELTGNISQYVTNPSFWHSSLLQATELKVLWWSTVCTKIPVSPLIFELHVTVKLYTAARSFLTLNHISSLSIRIRVCAICLMSVSLHKSAQLRMLGYQR
jgi:hypothetical protein